MTVYVIRCGDGPLYKIGTTTNVTSRMASLQTGQPEQLHLIRAMEGGRKVERAFQKAFQHRHVRGEWFVATPEMLTWEFTDLETAIAPGTDWANAALGRYLEDNRIRPFVFARGIKVSETAVYRYLQGQRIPRRSVMDRILAFTEGNVSPQSFYDSYRVAA